MILSEQNIKRLAELIFRPQKFGRIMAKTRVEMIKSRTKFSNLQKYKYKSFVLKTILGDELAGRYYFANVEPWAKIVLVHGYGGIQEEVEVIAPFFLEAGLDVIIYNVFDYDNKHAIITFGQKESEDLYQIMGYVMEAFNKGLPFALYGHSLGANTVLRAAANYPHVHIRFVIANAPFNQLDETLTAHLSKMFKLMRKDKEEALQLSQRIIQYAERKWPYDFSRIPMTDIVKKIKCPVLYIHGDQDDLNPTYMSEQLFACTPKAVLEIIEGANHFNQFTKEKEHTEYTLTLFLEQMKVSFLSKRDKVPQRQL